MKNKSIIALIHIVVLGVALPVVFPAAKAASPEVSALIEHEHKYGSVSAPSSLSLDKFLERADLIVSFLALHPSPVSKKYASTWKEYADMVKNDILPTLKTSQSLENVSVNQKKLIDDLLRRAQEALVDPVVASAVPNDGFRRPASPGASASGSSGAGSTGSRATASVPRGKDL